MLTFLAGPLGKEMNLGKRCWKLLLFCISPIVIFFIGIPIVGWTVDVEEVVFDVVVVVSEVVVGSIEVDVEVAEVEVVTVDIVVDVVVGIVVALLDAAG